MWKVKRMNTACIVVLTIALGALMIYPETEWVKAIDLAHFAIR